MASSEGLHIRAEFPAECLGDKCPNYQGSNCDDSVFEWVGAKATVTEDRDMEKTPLTDEAIFVSYGQICLQGTKSSIVGYRVDDYGNDRFFYDETGLIIHGDSRFGKGIDVSLYKVTPNEDGSVSEELTHTFDGWG